MWVCETSIYAILIISESCSYNKNTFTNETTFLYLTGAIYVCQWIWRLWCKSRVVTLLVLGLHENDEELKMHCANRAQHNRSKFLGGSKLSMGLFFPYSSSWVNHPERIRVLSHLSHQVRELIKIHMQHKCHLLPERLSDLFISWVVQKLLRGTESFVHSQLSCTAGGEGKREVSWEPMEKSTSHVS